MSLISHIARGLLLVALAIGPAIAQNPDGDGASTAEDPIEQLAAKALELFQAGDFKGAVTKYQEAYRYEPVSALLYNIAFIYDRKLNDLTLAKDFYRRYVNAPDADPDTRTNALERLAEINDELLRRERDASDADKAAAEKARLAAEEKAREEAEARRKAALEAWKVEVEQAGSARTTGWVIAGLGLAAGATGAVFMVQAQSTHDTFTNTDDVDERADLRSQGETQALVGDALAVAGGVALVTGVIIALANDDPPRPAELAPEPATGLRLVPSPDGIGFVFGGTF